MTAHAKKCPPSGADRWMRCTASVPLIVRLMDAGELKDSDLEKDEDIDEETIIDQSLDAYSDVVFSGEDSTSFSAEGTVMHTIREMCLSFGSDPFDYVGQTMEADGFKFLIDEDKADRLVAGIDWIRQHTDEPDIELRVDLGHWLPEQFGTTDCGFIAGKTLYISDYKNGIGKPVSAENNRQLMIYALGYWYMRGQPPIDRVILNVDQPRVGGMKFSEDIPFAQLLEFGEEVRRVYARIEAGDVEFVPTTAGCQFCPVRKTKRGCAAYNQWMLMIVGSGFFDPSQEVPSFRDPAQIPRALRWYIVQHASAVRSWLGTLYTESLNAAIAGDPDPGSKAIEGDIGNRYFTDKDQAEKLLIDALGAAAFKPQVVIGMTEIDRLVKPGKKKQGYPETWEALQELVSRPAGKPKLVPISHPKPALVVDHSDEFDDL